jgi:hypothetical protein
MATKKETSTEIFVTEQTPRDAELLHHGDNPTHSQPHESESSSDVTVPCPSQKCG